MGFAECSEVEERAIREKVTTTYLPGDRTALGFWMEKMMHTRTTYMYQPHVHPPTPTSDHAPEFFGLVGAGPLLGGSVPNLADYSFASLFAVAAVVIRNPITQVGEAWRARRRTAAYATARVCARVQRGL